MRLITPGLSFQFDYLSVRKIHFLLRAKAWVVFPGGYGTLDQLFETSLTLIQTKMVEPVPVLLFGRQYWQQVINFEMFAQEAAIAPADLELFQDVETAEEAWDAIQRFYGGADEGCRRRTFLTSQVSCGKGIRGYRAPIVIPLREGAACITQSLGLLGGLDALGQ